MADITLTTIPDSIRNVVANANYVSIALPAGWRQLDVVFEDSSGKAVLGVLVPGETLAGAPAATAARAFAWAALASNGSSFRVISVACPGGANHAFSLVVS